MSQLKFLLSTGKIIDLDGKPIDSDVLMHKTLLIVNVASRCGLTPQYTQLVQLQNAFADKGFSVVGVPCNQFARQEPGTPARIRQFCEHNYGVNFPLLEKQDVNGPTRSPLYQWLVGEGEDISWNFGKFLVSSDGVVLERFAPNEAPDSSKIVLAIQEALSSS